MTRSLIIGKAEATDVAALLELRSLDYGNYLVVVKSDFDLIVDDEPYLAVMFLFNVTTGKYIARIWNQTVSTGIVTTQDQLMAACKTHFEHKPCLGCPESAHDKTQLDFLISQTPIPRKISKSCHRVLKKGIGSEVSCPECNLLKETKNQTAVEDVEPQEEVIKKETLHDTEETECSSKNLVVDEVKKEDSELQMSKSEDVFETDFKEEYFDMEGDLPVISRHLSQPTKLKAKRLQQRSNAKATEETQYGNGILWGSRKLSYPRKCSLCEQVFASKEKFQKHLKHKHNAGYFACCTCKFRVSFANELVEHMMKQNHTEDPYVKCPSCKESLHMQDFVNHYEKCIISLKQKQRKGKEVMCQICGKACFRKDIGKHLKTHLRKEGKDESDIKHLLPNSKINSNLYYYCEMCGKRFTTQHQLRKHIQVEHDKIGYQCKMCTKTFKTHKGMLEHANLDHSTDEKYNCRYCGKRFGSLNSLKSHTIYHHEAPKFKCQYCGKMFKMKKSLESHERMHTGEKPFPCSICETGFTSRGSLAQHMSGVHKIANKGRKLGWYRKGKHELD